MTTIADHYRRVSYGMTQETNDEPAPDAPWEAVPYVITPQDLEWLQQGGVLKIDGHAGKAPTFEAQPELYFKLWTPP